jgi:hypothetical protein
LNKVKSLQLFGWKHVVYHIDEIKAMNLNTHQILMEVYGAYAPYAEGQV